MNNTFYYKAFGLTIASAFPIVQATPIEPCEPDVRVICADLSTMADLPHLYVTEESVFFRGEEQVEFLITGGNLVQVHPSDDYTPSYLSVYIMGSCMGAILQQRGFMLMHGSCVTDGHRSILITGQSGAGKSTLAAEFLKQGWKLITDDVTTVFDRDGVPMVQSSYPSQKLWNDALNRYQNDEHSVHSLYTDRDREKFGVHVNSDFMDGTAPLSLVVRLAKADHEVHLEAMEGMAKIDQLVRNSYRFEYIAPSKRSRHFQRCVNLAGKIPMVLALRENDRDCAGILYTKITTFMEEHCHD